MAPKRVRPTAQTQPALSASADTTAFRRSCVCKKAVWQVLERRQDVKDELDLLSREQRAQLIAAVRPRLRRAKHEG